LNCGTKWREIHNALGRLLLLLLWVEAISSTNSTTLMDNEHLPLAVAEVTFSRDDLVGVSNLLWQDSQECQTANM